MSTFTTTPSFSFDFGATSVKPEANKPIASARLRSTAQEDYYLSLCAKKGVMPTSYLNMNFEQLDAEIKRVFAYFPATQAQLDKIDKLILDLAEAGVTVKIDKSTLTGGKEGSASSFIQYLIDECYKHSENMPPNDTQLLKMCKMFHCPAVPFEQYGIERRIWLEGEPEMWRNPTAEEFATVIRTTMKKNEASKFLDEYETKFFDWQRTRIMVDSPKWSLIRTLEQRMANMESPIIKEWAVDENGQMVQVEHKVDRNQYYNPTGFVPVENEHLMLFSVEEADKYIDILKSDLKRKESEETDKAVRKFEKVEEGNGDDSKTFEELRRAKTVKEAIDNEFKGLQDLMFKLEAVAGYNDENLHNAISSLLVDNVNEESERENKLYIKEFMLNLIDDGYISFGAMADLCRDSLVAIRILIGR